MRFGVNLPNFGPYADAAAMADLAAAADRSGWHGFFVWDHIVVADAMPVGDPWVILTAAAMATRRLTIGPMVTPLPRRRPWVVARQAVTLDRLSKGRLVLGVGLGFPAEEFTTFGEPADPAGRATRLDEALDVIAGMWSGAPFSYTGKHHDIVETTFLPRPLQQPRIPIWVAGTWPHRAPFRRAARFDGVYPLADDEGVPVLIGPEGVREAVAEVAAHRSTMDGYDVSALVVVTGDADDDRAGVEAFRAAGVTWAHVAPGPDEDIAEVAAWIEAGPPPS